MERKSNRKPNRKRSGKQNSKTIEKTRNSVKITPTAIAMLLGLVLVLIVACVVFDKSLAYGFLAAILTGFLFFMCHGLGKRDLLMMMRNGLLECKMLYALILLIGATVSVWLASGVVPSMMYYGFEYMKGMNFLFVAFLIMSCSAVFMGTAVGTVSTIGIAILGIGSGFGIPTGVLLGVIVSGAFVADKISPISGLLNLTLTTTGTNYRQALSPMLRTLLPTLIISGIIYFILGSGYDARIDVSAISEYQKSISQAFFTSPLLLLMPVLIVGMSCLGIKTVYAILTGLGLGTVISMGCQHMKLAEVLRAIIFGYHGSTPSQKLNTILVSGGMISMLEVLIIVMGAIALSSMLEGTGVIGFLTDKMIETIKGKRELLVKTGLMSSILTVVTCDQTMGIVLPGRLLVKKYDDLEVDRTILVRTISDTGTIIAPLMPWNVNSLIIGIVTGVTSGYAPYAVLCYIAPAVTLAFALTAGKESRTGKQ